MTGNLRDRIEDEAALWAMRLAEDGWTDADEAALQVWLARDPVHKGALLAASAVWSLVAAPANVREAGTAPAQSAPASSMVQLRRRTILAGFGTAIAASFAGGIFWWSQAKTYATDLGEIRRVPLADGSIAAINTASEFGMRLTDKRRSIMLARGEAWFQVAKDPSRPFVVEAGRVRVQAVGTAFSVRRREGGAEILVTEGVVEAWADGAEGGAVRLVAGERAYIADNARVEAGAAGPSSIDRALAWRGGKIDLARTSLADAVAEFNRYNHRRLVIVDPRLAGEELDGVFGTDDPTGFAQTVHDLLDVPIDLTNNDEIRIGRPVR